MDKQLTLSTNRKRVMISIRNDFDSKWRSMLQPLVSSIKRRNESLSTNILPTKIAANEVSPLKCNNFKGGARLNLTSKKRAH